MNIYSVSSSGVYYFINEKAWEGMGGYMLFPQGHQPVSSNSRTETQHSFSYCKTHACASPYWTWTSSPGFGPALPPLMSPVNLDKLPKFFKLWFSHL